MALACNVGFELRTPDNRARLDLRHLPSDSRRFKKPAVAVKALYNLGIRSTLVHSNGERDFRLLAGLPPHRNIMCVLANMGLVALNGDVVELVQPELRDLCQDAEGNFRKTMCIASQLHHRGTLKTLVLQRDSWLQTVQGVLVVACGIVEGVRHLGKYCIVPVSYTHLTLPTIYSV